MYRRPKSLEVILAIRKTMSEEAAHDIPTLVDMVRTGVRPVDTARTVTREEGPLCGEVRTVIEQPKAAVTRD
jgi:hypothetical protein